MCFWKLTNAQGEQNLWVHVHQGWQRKRCNFCRQVCRETPSTGGSPLGEVIRAAHTHRGENSRCAEFLTGKLEKQAPSFAFLVPLFFLSAKVIGGCGFMHRTALRADLCVRLSGICRLIGIICSSVISAHFHLLSSRSDVPWYVRIVIFQVHFPF